MFLSHKFVFPLIALAASLALPAAARADFSGFGNFSAFSINQTDSGSAPTVTGSTLNLINGNSQNRSIFNKTPQNITQFTASFTYQATGSSDYYNGAAFVLQNSAAGANTVGYYDYGYQYMPGKSIAVTLDLTSLTGYFTNGNIGSGSSSTSPVNLISGHPINVTLTYDGSELYETLVDTITSAAFNKTYLILTPIQTVLGANTAYVGITDSSYGYSNQSFSNFQFTSSGTIPDPNIPEPASLAILALGGILALGRRRRA